MMFLDASAVVAIILQEDDAPDLSQKINSHKGDLFYSPLVLFEVTTSCARALSGARRPSKEQFEAAAKIARSFFAKVKAKPITITPVVGDKALGAAARYGKMVAHEADLNFGDCYSYACADTYSIPLLYKGNDFAKTDLA